MSGHVKPGPTPKGGKRHTVRFRHSDVLQRAREAWQALGFSDFSEYVDFTFSLAHGKWQEYKFASAEEAADYLLALSRGAVTTPPPHLLTHGAQDTLSLSDAAA